MQTKHLYVLFHIYTKGEVGAHEASLSPPIIFLLLTVFYGSLMLFVISVLFLLCFRARLFIDALWSSAGKGLISWLSFVMSNCEVVTYPLVSWVMCGA